MKLSSGLQITCAPTASKLRWLLLTFFLLLMAALGQTNGSPDLDPRATAQAATPPHYKIIDLGVLTTKINGNTYTPNESFPTGINQMGQVCGYGLEFFIENGALKAFYRPFLYSDGALHDLGTLGGHYGYGYGINDSGQVVGYSATSGDSSEHAFLFSGGPLQDLGTLSGNSSYANDTNNSGDVTGKALLADNQRTHAFLFSAGVMKDLGSFGGSSVGIAINNSRQVTGYSYLTGQTYHAFLYSGGSLQDLGSLAGNSGSSIGLQVNDAGQVVGQSLLSDNNPNHYHAFSSSGGNMVDLGVLYSNPNSTAIGINNSGQIVGDSGVAGSPGTAFLYSAGVMYDLNELVPGGNNSVFNHLATATAINDNGWIVGTGFQFGNFRRGFLAIPLPPVPPPPIHYKVIDLGTLGGKSSGAFAINNHGQIVGSASTSGNQSRATLFSVSNGVVSRTDLSTTNVPGYASDINEAGQITANEGSDSTYKATLLTLSNGAVTRQELAGFSGSNHTEARSLNALSQIVGFSLDPKSQNFRAVVFSLDGSPAKDLGDLGVSNDTTANAINDSGQVVGFSYIPSGVSGRSPVPHATLFSLSGASPKDLGTKPLDTSYANDINAAGQIAGYQMLNTPVPAQHATISTIASDGTVLVINLTKVPTNISFADLNQSAARAINNLGQATGSAGGHAIVYLGGALYDMNEIIAPENMDDFKSLNSGNGINDSGWVVGTGTTTNGETHAFLAMPPSNAAPSQLLNVSTRLNVSGGDNVAIGGFIITGSEPKKVLIRGIGPSLAQFISGSLSDPTLELFQGDTLLQMNDDWKTDQEAEITATGIPPGNNAESAIVRTLDPGSYTAILRGKGGATGIGVIEAYDLNQAANSKFGNIATRGFVDSGDNALIGGFIIGPAGGASTTVVVRATGPSLTNFGIAGALQDPTIELHDGNGAILAFNDNWAGDVNQGLIPSSLKPSDPRECAVYLVLPPGNYTAVVRGSGNSTGVGLVEVYNIQ